MSISICSLNWPGTYLCLGFRALSTLLLRTKTITTMLTKKMTKREWMESNQRSTLLSPTRRSFVTFSLHGNNSRTFESNDVEDVGRWWDHNFGLLGEWFLGSIYEGFESMSNERGYQAVTWYAQMYLMVWRKQQCFYEAKNNAIEPTVI